MKGGFHAGFRGGVWKGADGGCDVQEDAGYWNFRKGGGGGGGGAGVVGSEGGVF